MFRATAARQAREAALESFAAELLTRRFRAWARSGELAVALVFTGIVDAPYLGEELQDQEWAAVLDAHLGRARALLDRETGYTVKATRTGETLLSAFRSVPAALDFALELYRDPGHERVRIRAGLHVGVVRVEEDDGFGSLVSFTARLLDQARDAEIWLSDEARKQLNGTAAAGLPWLRDPRRFISRFPGTHQLWSVVPPVACAERAS
jgi:class 3 adenylate cyclase